MNDKILAKLENAPKIWWKNLIITIICVLILLWSASTVGINNIPESGLSMAGRIFSSIFHPNTALLFNFTQSGVAYLLLETICIAFLATIVGSILAIPLSFLSAPNIVSAPISIIGRTLIMMIRTIPPIIYGLMFVRVTGPGPFAGLMTMSLCSIGMISKMYIEVIEDLDPKILESMDAGGCSRFRKIRYGVLPQLIPDFLSTVIYRFDMNLRDASVLGLVGAGGIGAPLIFAMNGHKWNDVGAILIGLIILVLIVEFFSTCLRKKLVHG